MTILTIILQVALGVFARNPELSAGNLSGCFYEWKKVKQYK
jgi:hypothetical protein